MELYATIEKAPPKRRAALARHRRKCALCAHPQREAIEAAFLRFQSVAQIASAHGIRDRRTIYRHAHARGLFIRRNRALASSLELILEKGDRLEPTTYDIIRAAEKYSKIDEHGEKFRRPKPITIYVSTESALGATSRPQPGPQNQNPNRHNFEANSTANHSKQTTETPSNRHKFGGCLSQKNPRDEAAPAAFPAELAGPGGFLAGVPGIRYSPGREREER